MEIVILKYTADLHVDCIPLKYVADFLISTILQLKNGHNLWNWFPIESI